jgi:hypothetical protein
MSALPPEAVIRGLLSRYPKRLRISSVKAGGLMFSFSAAYLSILGPNISFQTAGDDGMGTILRSNGSATARALPCGGRE